MIIFFLILALLDILFLKSTNDLITLLLLGFWLYLVIKNHWKSRLFLKAGLILIVPTAFFLIFQANLIAEKTAFWIYVLFTSAVLQEIVLKIRIPGKS